MNGIVIVNKPLGMSSARAVAQLKRAYGVGKAGHAGTLDPGAAGILLVCLGRATRFSDYLMNAGKEYICEITFGAETETEDAYGHITARFPQPVSQADVERALPLFTGEIYQIPPQYSALKWRGKKMYEYALKGEHVPKEARKITVSSLSLLKQTGRQRFLLQVACSKGTYIRTLCADIGRALNSGAYMSGLVRSASGSARLSQAHLPHEILAMGKEEQAKCVLPPESLLSHLPAVSLNGEQAALFAQGVKLQAARIEGLTEGPVRIYGGAVFCGIGIKEEDCLRVLVNYANA